MGLEACLVALALATEPVESAGAERRLRARLMRLLGTSEPTRQLGGPGAPRSKPGKYRGEAEAELLLGLQRGDVEALEETMRRYQGRLLGYARRKGAEEQLAEELVQEVFVVLVQKGEGLPANSKLGAWLMGVLRNKLRDVWKSYAHRHEEDAEDLDAVREVDVEAEWRQLAARYALRQLAEAIDATCSLSEEELLLRMAAGATGPELAAELGVSADAVRKRRSRALKKVRTVMEKKL